MDCHKCVTAAEVERGRWKGVAWEKTPYAESQLTAAFAQRVRGIVALSSAATARMSSSAISILGMWVRNESTQTLST